MTRHRTLGPSLTLDCACDDALKTEVARFRGHHYVAEREDDELVVFALADEHGQPAQLVTTDHLPVRTLADLNHFHANHYPRRKSA
jgi:hypothetical protein